MIFGKNPFRKSNNAGEKLNPQNMNTPVSDTGKRGRALGSSGNFPSATKQTSKPETRLPTRRAHFDENFTPSFQVEPNGSRKKEETGAEYERAIQAMIEKAIAEESSGQRYPLYEGLEDYTLLSKTGDGAFSNVYKAINNTTGEKVAIKAVQRAQPVDPINPGRRQGCESHNILKEIQLMRRVQHPNIIQLLDFIQTPENFFLVLELAEGGELFHQIVRFTYFSEELARHVILQTAHAIRYLHEDCGIVHRDIKPENLLFDPIDFIPSKIRKYRAGDDPDKADEGEFRPGVGGGTIGRIRLADFGLSKVIWDSHTQTPCGTMGYTAPEIVRDGRYSKSVDMWALGCVLYTVLCGFPPFYDESISSLTNKVAHGQYTFLSPWWDDISKGAKDLVSHLLTVDPDSRYDIHQLLAHPWITQSEEPTFPASDAPPMKSESPFSYDVATFADDEIPSARTPGVNSLREIFNISYAAHRMEQERLRKRLYRGNQGMANFYGNMNDLIEEEGEYDPATSNVEHALKRINIANSPNSRSPNTASPQQKPKKQHDSGFKGFQLNLSNATLYNRRHKPGASTGDF
ncbi:MAPK-activated protein kinase Srk1 [Schizosaccharomyces osmophilus]|uniref:MAPK-activated protein kinase Srk1 n=1 Tax=Schizosaccharomyces osmophilus TaxID=2545709 RepID=A0AAF0AZ18_9SCHI|nr:MAPK-activated protein kinase Srk1 [Schizosaccharomyces osmophilus]WBW75440.1 MAPK-activated protein kinase Srk1 [Schizosaccharomyces osmophilus]